MSKSNAGVRLILVRGTRIPNWIRVQDKNVKCWTDTHNGRPVRILSIRRGDGRFLPAGMTGVLLPGSSEWWVAFDSTKVLKILSFSGREVLETNRHLCDACTTNTCRVVSHKASEIAGKRMALMRCLTCQKEDERII